MMVVLLFVFAWRSRLSFASMQFASMGARTMRLSSPSTVAGVLVGLAISFIGLRPWFTQFGAPLSIQLFDALLAAAASWVVIRNQVRITRQHVLWVFLTGIAFLLSFERQLTRKRRSSLP